MSTDPLAGLRPHVTVPAAPPLPMAPASAPQSTPKRATGNGTTVDALVTFGRTTHTFHRSESRQKIAVPVDGPNVAVPAGRSFRERLAGLVHAASGKVPADKQLQEAEAILFADVDLHSRLEVSKRVAGGLARGRIVIDLGYPTGQAIEVTPGLWRLVDRSPETFQRNDGLTHALPVPVRCGPAGARRLFDLLGVAPDDHDLLLAVMVLAFIPDIPHPILHLTGEQGAAKTTTSRFIGRLIDPTALGVLQPPGDEEQWTVTCSAVWLVILDNLSTIPDWLSDALCRTVTGSALAKRTLYTDGDVSAIATRRPVIVNGMTGGALRGDLAQRIIPLHLTRPTTYVSEAKLNRAFDAIAAEVLGGLLDMLAAVLATDLEALEDELAGTLPRMADFALLLAAVDRANGTNALATYLQRVNESMTDAADADPVATAVAAFMAGRYTREPWEGTAKDLLGLLARPLMDDGAFWPRSPRALTSALNRSAGPLREAHGIVITRHRTASERRIQLSWMAVATVTHADATTGAGEPW